MGIKLVGLRRTVNKSVDEFGRGGGRAARPFARPDGHAGALRDGAAGVLTPGALSVAAAVVSAGAGALRGRPARDRPGGAELPFCPSEFDSVRKICAISHGAGYSRSS